ncbi:MAG: DNA translocase FtsK [Eubacteriales bacterium]|nr:DNA translocase FtsK [Eubacteriales bacterium]
MKAKVKTYSSDSLLLRTIVGIALCALSALFLLCMIFSDRSTVLFALHSFLYGLCSVMSPVFTLLLLWGGLLTLISTRRKPKSTFYYICICLFFLMLLTLLGIQSIDSINAYAQQLGKTYPTAYLTTLETAYYINSHYAANVGGFLNMLLAWPAWKYIGAQQSLAIVYSLCALCLLPMILRAFLKYRKAIKEDRAALDESWQKDEAKPLADYAAADGAEDASESLQRVSTAMNAKPQNRPVTINQQRRPLVPKQEFEEIIPADQFTEDNVPHTRKPKRGKRGGVQFEEASTDIYTEDIYPPSFPAGAAQEQVRHAPPEWADLSAETGKPEFTPASFDDDGFAEEAPWIASAGPWAVPQKTTETIKPAPVKPETVEKTPFPPRGGYKTEGAEQKTTIPAPIMPQPVKPEVKAPIVSPIIEDEPDDFFENETIYQPQSAAAQKSKSRRRSTKDTAAPSVPSPAPVINYDTARPLRLDETPIIRPQRAHDEIKQNKNDEYHFPTPDLLTPAPVRVQQDIDADRRKAEKLEETIKSFGIAACVRSFVHGPAITQFSVEIAQGVRLQKLLNISDTIALSMAASGVIMEAIPGTSYVGVEIPNDAVETVHFSSIVNNPVFTNQKSPLTVALGQQINGNCVVCDLSKMPHLLIAGATGSGKSVCINSIICSILFRSSPKDVRMILVDPKVVELQVYEGIPHLLVPVVSNPKKAAGALRWAVDEMMERYKKFTERKVRNIAGFNSALKSGEDKMPHILIIIDELADLMIAAKKEVEEYIQRLSQLARAAGIHMVVATQRPSVDVVTGTIKANIPSRIAFAVSSYTDSRTILDRNGAEKLLGKGDMLYNPMGAFKPTRVQGCFLDDDEVTRIVEYIKRYSHAEYDPDILEELDKEEKEETADMEYGGDIPEKADAQVDSYLQKAIKMAVEEGQMSISMLQRRLRVGYGRAGHLVDEMARRGIISQSEGAKSRKTLISRSEYMDMFPDDEDNSLYPMNDEE